MGVRSCMRMRYVMPKRGETGTGHCVTCPALMLGRAHRVKAPRPVNPIAATFLSCSCFPGVLELTQDPGTKTLSFHRQMQPPSTAGPLRIRNATWPPSSCVTPSSGQGEGLAQSFSLWTPSSPGSLWCSAIVIPRSFGAFVRPDSSPCNPIFCHDTPARAQQRTLS